MHDAKKHRPCFLIFPLQEASSSPTPPPALGFVLFGVSSFLSLFSFTTMRFFPFSSSGVAACGSPARFFAPAAASLVAGCWSGAAGFLGALVRPSARSFSGFVCVCAFSSSVGAVAFAARAAACVGVPCVVRRAACGRWVVSVPVVPCLAPRGVWLRPAAFLGCCSGAVRSLRAGGALC
jgi:hypothetical protein